MDSNLNPWSFCFGRTQMKAVLNTKITDFQSGAFQSLSASKSLLTNAGIKFVLAANS
jgi:hypothetical protein